MEISCIFDNTSFLKKKVRFLAPVAITPLPSDNRGFLYNLAKYKENCKMLSYNRRIKQYKTIGAKYRI